MGRRSTGIRCGQVALALLGLARLASAQSQQVELIADGDFGPNQAAWGDANIVDGQLCLDVPGGTINPWDVGISQAGVPIVTGEVYELSFDAKASPRNVVVRALVQVPSPPYATALDRNPTLTPELQHFSFTFQASSDLTAAVSVQVGGATEPWTLFHMPTVVLARATTPTRMARKRSATIRPYSTAVAALVSRASR